MAEEWDENVRFHARCDCTIWLSAREHYVHLALALVGLFLYVLTAPSALAQTNAKNVLVIYGSAANTEYGLLDLVKSKVRAQVPEPVKEERNHDLLNLVNSWARRRGEPFVGREIEILCEGPSKTNPDRLMGRTRGNKIVVFEGSERHLGQLFPVRINRSTGYTLYGDPAIFS